MSHSPNPFADNPPPNPYTAPIVPGGLAPPPGTPGFFVPPPGTAQFASCPSCGNTFASKIGFTWWGGMLGPALFTHVKCCRCGNAYNGKTGRSNTLAITIYIIVGTLIFVALGAALTWGGIM